MNTQQKMLPLQQIKFCFKIFDNKSKVTAVNLYTGDSVGVWDSIDSLIALTQLGYVKVADSLEEYYWNKFAS